MNKEGSARYKTKTQKSQAPFLLFHPSCASSPLSPPRARCRASISYMRCQSKRERRPCVANIHGVGSATGLLSRTSPIITTAGMHACIMNYSSRPFFLFPPSSQGKKGIKNRHYVFLSSSFSITTTICSSLYQRFSHVDKHNLLFLGSVSVRALGMYPSERAGGPSGVLGITGNSYIFFFFSLCSLLQVLLLFLFLSVIIIIITSRLAVIIDLYLNALFFSSSSSQTLRPPLPGLPRKRQHSELHTIHTFFMIPFFFFLSFPQLSSLTS